MQYKAVNPETTKEEGWYPLRDFTVPYSDAAWPEKAWGKNLGRIVENIRLKSNYKGHREELEALGINFLKHHCCQGSLGWNVLNSCLVQYKEANRETTKEKGWYPPRDFKVPSGAADWPEAAWGKPLGKIVHHIRYNDTYKEHREELEALGIDFSKQENHKHLGWDVLKACLVKYKKEYNPKTTKEKGWFPTQDFTVPEGDAAWPKEAWGRNLGKIVDPIRYSDTFKDRREELEALGINFLKRKRGGWDVVKACLVQYKAVNPETTKEKGWFPPQNFTVPEDDADWPEEAWGKNLGRIARNILYNGSYKEHRGELEALGIDFKKQKHGGQGALGWDVLKACLVHYKAKDNPKTTKKKGWFPPQNFYVPEGDAAWPKEAWGKPLGKIVNNIRHKGYYRDHHEELKALGIVVKAGK